MLFDLPDEIVTDIYAGWLRLKDVARMDSAFCNIHCRSSHLSVISKRNVVYSIRQNPTQMAVQRTQWCAMRGIHLDGIDVGRDLLGPLKGVRAEYLRSHGEHIKWVDISIPEEARRGSCNALLDVAKWCSNVKEVQVGRYSRLLGGSRGRAAWDKPLLALAQSCPLVEKLHVESLECSPVGLVNSLQQFQNLTHLALKNLNHNDLPAAIAIPSLTYLDIRNSIATDDLMVVIGRHCARLQTLYVFEDPKVTNSNEYVHPYAEAFVMPCDVTDDGVRALLEGCPMLKFVDVENAEEISHELRVALVARCGFTTLELEYWEGQVDNSLVQGLLKVCPALETFEALPWCVSDATLAVCAQYCPLLKRLCVRYCENITAAAVAAVLRPGNILCKLSLDDCPQLGDEVGLAIARNCPLLEDLRCVRTGLTDASMVEIAKGCSRLQSVGAVWTRCGDASCIALAEHCKELGSLSLTSISATAVGALVEHATTLSFLHLVTSTSDDALLPLAERGVRVFAGGRNLVPT